MLQNLNLKFNYKFYYNLTYLKVINYNKNNLKILIAYLK